MMAASVRATVRLLQHLSPLPSMRIPLRQPTVMAGPPGRTTVARTMAVGTIRPGDAAFF